MCGIVGIIDFAGLTPNPAMIEAALDRIQHRGPDGHAMFARGGVALGHQRLSIIDLEGGRQPLCNEDEQVWITFNGEIYNYRELRSELQSLGHRFRTNSDTETLVHAWEQWGTDCLNRLRGMFALVIADFRTRQIFAARDQLGIKPLLYALDEQRFVFASEFAALVPCGVSLDVLDHESIDQYLQFGYIPSPRSAYKHVRKLPAAHYLLMSMDGGGGVPQRYWQLQFKPDQTLSSADWQRSVADAVDDSVSAHLVADVPFGAFLSGGIDSTAIVGSMSKVLPDPVKTFAIGFEETEFNELTYARQVANRYRTEHFEKIVRPDALDLLPALVKHYGEPYGDSSAIASFYLCQLAREHVPMVLSGDGGDEAFAGYGRYASWRKRLLPYRPQRSAHKQVARGLLSKLAPGRFPDESRGPLPTPELWMASVRKFSPSQRRQLWQKGEFEPIGDGCERLEEVYRTQTECDPNAMCQAYDYHTYLPDDILTKMDIASMAYGLEVRTPLVDVRIAELAATIPPAMNMRVEGDHWTGKQPLRAYVEKDFGASFFQRPKAGFCVPLKHWFSASGPLHALLRERITDPAAKLAGLFDMGAVNTLLDQHSERCDHSQRLWQLLFLEQWLQDDLPSKAQDTDGRCRIVSQS